MFLLKLLAVCIISTFQNSAVTASINIKGYFWRDFFGDVPDDAVSTTDAYGQEMYIGQALHIGPVNGKLIPGTIYQGQNKMEYAWNDEVHETNVNIKILCSDSPQKLIWLDVPKIEDLEPADHSRLVIGGYDTNYYLYIGKIQRNGQTKIGKVTMYKRYEGMAFVHDHRADFTKTDFKILGQGCAELSTISVN